MPANYQAGRRGGIVNVSTLRDKLSLIRSDLDEAFRLAISRMPQTAVGWSSWKFIQPSDKVVLEGSFLRLVSAWDGFIENTFCYYLPGGGQSLSNPPVLCNPKHPTVGASAQYALKTYRSNPNAKYLTWSRIHTVAKWSAKEFSLGDPYDKLKNFLSSNSSHNLIVKAARSTRNMIAHETDSARAAFVADVSQVIVPRIVGTSRPYMVLLEQAVDPVSGKSVHLFEAVSSVYGCLAGIVGP